MKTMVKPEKQIHMMEIGKLKIEEPFDSLACAHTDSSVHAYTRISMDMELNGFDPAEPLIVWRGRNIVIFGQDLYRSALHKGYKEVPVIEKDFKDEDEAVDYLRHLRRDRGDWTDADIFMWLEHYDKRGKRDRPPKNVSNEAISRKLSERVRIAKNESLGRFNPYTPPEKWVGEIRKTFQLFHIAKYQKRYSRTSERLAVEFGIKDKNLFDRAWYIIDHGDEQIKEHVRRGWLQIYDAYKKIRKFEAGAISYTIKFQGISLQIPVKMAEEKEIDIRSLRWIILGSGDPPNTLPEEGKIYHKG